MISKETFKTFLIYFLTAGFVILCINTFYITNNQTRIIDNQEKGIPIVNDTNIKLTQMGENLAHLSEKIK